MFDSDKMNKDRLISMVFKAINTRDSHLTPSFYAITGSHIYGMNSEDSDIDLRGFHIAEKEKFLTLNSPKDQIEINQGGVTEGFENYKNVDLVSYELRKFGYLISKSNFNILELIFHGSTVIDGDPLSTESLKKTMRDHLPMNTAVAYRGMAKSNYKKYLNREKDEYRPEAKKFLYVIRGLLGAIYTLEEEDIIANISDLSFELGRGISVVRDLVEHKINFGDDEVPPELEESSHSLILDLTQELATYDLRDDDWRNQREELIEEINRWMLDRRAL